MDIHEFQAKRLLQDLGLPVQKGCLVENADLIATACSDLKAPFVVKAQVHAGGRGKGGGIRFAKTVDEASTMAQKLLGHQLITPQTGPEGKRVNSVYIVEAADFEREYYLSLFVNREASCITLTTSYAGGGDIEDVAQTSPESILSLDFDPLYGLKDFHIAYVADFLSWPPALYQELRRLLKTLYHFFTEKDLSLLEINPLVITQQNQMLIVDAKMVFDDNALFRHLDIVALCDPRELAPQEVDASEHGLSYVQLDGDIGCMVNGAGLAMATMDTVAHLGGKPSNFLDAGGSASFEQIKAALRIILSDPEVRVVLVNIFGGITHCDLIAKGLDEAVQDLGTSKPIVVRLAGTHADQAMQILSRSKARIETATSLEDAAARAVALSKEAV